MEPRTVTKCETSLETFVSVCKTRCMDTLRLPGDPHGIEEPYDVLAADEFAMPSHGDIGPPLLKSGGSRTSLIVLVAAALALVLLVALRRR